jgi:hypothetical protein
LQIAIPECGGEGRQLSGSSTQGAGRYAP